MFDRYSSGARRLCLLAGFAGVALCASAQVPQFLNFQGRLLNGTNLVNGSVGLSLRLFNVSAGGTKLYEDSNSVAVVDGLYSTFIGDNPTNSAFLSALTNASVWVEVAVNGVALSPRERLSSVGYSLATRGLAVDAATTNVGIGTIAPQTRLEVAGSNGTAVRVTGPGGGGTTVSLDLSTYDAGLGNPPGVQLRATDNNYSADVDVLTKIPGGAANALTSRLRIASSSGNVGVGTLSPTELLHVNGRVVLGDSANAPVAGTIRWSGADFEGYNGTRWVSLTAGQALVTPVAGMVWIAPGSFTMGSPSNEVGVTTNEAPMTSVSITRGYWIGSREVTQGEWIALLTNNPSFFTGDTNRPVESMTWLAATNYCAQLTIREQTAGRIPANWSYRLPTEAEWEFAARAGTQTRFYFGDDPTYASVSNYAWYASNSVSTTHAVGLLIPNARGLFDVLGNVSEMCSDWFGALPGGAVVHPAGTTTGSVRVARGGSYSNTGPNMRVGRRSSVDPTFASFAVGFRIVLAPN